MTVLRLGVFVSLLLLVGLYGQRYAAGLGEGYLGEFEVAAMQSLQLAEATPAEKFLWRPAPGVRSIGEVYMHVAIGNYGLVGAAGVKLPPEASELKRDSESKITAKAEVVGWLKASQELVRQSYPTADRKKVVKFLGKEQSAENVFLRILNHNHEHMGQSIAYARMNGIAPPWSK